MGLFDELMEVGTDSSVWYLMKELRDETPIPRNYETAHASIMNDKLRESLSSSRKLTRRIQVNSARHAQETSGVKLEVPTGDSASTYSETDFPLISGGAAALERAHVLLGELNMTYPRHTEGRRSGGLSADDKAKYLQESHSMSKELIHRLSQALFASDKARVREGGRELGKALVGLGIGDERVWPAIKTQLEDLQYSIGNSVHTEGDTRGGLPSWAVPLVSGNFVSEGSVHVLISNAEEHQRLLEATCSEDHKAHWQKTRDDLIVAVEELNKTLEGGSDTSAVPWDSYKQYCLASTAFYESCKALDAKRYGMD